MHITKKGKEEHGWGLQKWDIYHPWYNTVKNLPIFWMFYFFIYYLLKKFIFLSILFLNMVKKFNNDDIFIKGLLYSGMKPPEIKKNYKNKCRELKITFQKLKNTIRSKLKKISKRYQ